MRQTPHPEHRRRGALSARALGFASGDDYIAAKALRDDDGESSPHAERLAERDRQAPRPRGPCRRRLAPPEWLAGLGE